VTTELAHGFDLTLMRHLPELFCSEVKPNSIYGKMDYISLLVKASILNGYAEGTSNVSRKLGRAPTGDTVLSYFKTTDRYELLSASSILFEEQVDELRRKGLLSRPVPIAFDWHDQLFYGEKGSEMVNGVRPKNGSSYAYQYLTASILVDGSRLTVVLTPKSREHMLAYIEDALNRMRNMGIRVRHLLFDAGFTSLALPRFLGEQGYAYALRFSSNEITKRIGLKDGEEALYPSDHPFRLVRADDLKAGKSYLFATNMACRPRTVLRRYKRRWGIETSYREHNVFLAKTTSKDYAVRLLYYAVAVCIYNAWCVFNARRQNHVIALEAKVSVLLLMFSAPAMPNHQRAEEDDHG
jgi:Transposase DDE domain